MEYVSKYVVRFPNFTRQQLRQLPVIKHGKDAETLRQIQWGEALSDSRFPDIGTKFKPNQRAKADPIDIYEIGL